MTTGESSLACASGLCGRPFRPHCWTSQQWHPSRELMIVLHISQPRARLTYFASAERRPPPGRLIVAGTIYVQTPPAGGASKCSASLGVNSMTRIAACVAPLLVWVGSAVWVSSAYADSGVTDNGTWPKSWPVELESLRKSARTLEGPLQPLLHYAIPFTKREEFESAWPLLLKVKSKGAPIVLVRGPSFW